MRRTLQAAVAAATGLILAAAPAPAAKPAKAPKPVKTSTFAGSCEFDGVVRFEPPLTANRAEVSSRAIASGPCTGTWRHGDKVFDLAGEHVRYRATASAPQSCDSAESTGEGFLRYRRKRLRFTFAESRVLTRAEIHLEGAAGGAFDAVGTASGDPVAAVEACFGDGLAETEVSIDGATDTEISG